MAQDATTARPRRVLPDWFFDSKQSLTAAFEKQEAEGLADLCAEARELIEAALERHYNRGDEPTLEEVLADMLLDDDDERLLHRLFLSGRSPAAAGLAWEAFRFRCTHDLVFALKAVTLQ